MVFFYSSPKGLGRWNTAMPICLHMGYMSTFSLHPRSRIAVTDYMSPQMEHIYCLALFQKNFVIPDLKYIQQGSSYHFSIRMQIYSTLCRAALDPATVPTSCYLGRPPAFSQSDR